MENRQVRSSTATNVDEKYGDIATGDSLIALLQKHKMTAWMLRGHQGEG